MGDALPDAAVEAAVKKCVAPPASIKRQAEVVSVGGLALTTYATQVGSEGALKASLGIEPAKLEAVWATVPAATRKIWADNFIAGALPERMMTAIAEASVRAYPGPTPAQIRKAPEFEHFVAYFAGRALREQLEREF